MWVFGELMSSYEDCMMKLKKEMGVFPNDSILESKEITIFQQKHKTSFPLVYSVGVHKISFMLYNLRDNLL